MHDDEAYTVLDRTRHYYSANYRDPYVTWFTIVLIGVVLAFAAMVAFEMITPAHASEPTGQPVDFTLTVPAEDTWVVCSNFRGARGITHLARLCS